MRSSLYALVGGAASALASVRGFNYASQGQDEASFKAQFEAAQGLAGADDYSSARLYTMIQDGSTDTVIGAIPAAISTKTTLLLGVWASEDETAFQNEITALTSAITQYGSDFASLVVGISVGSEDLYRISPTGIAAGSGAGQSPDVLVDYIGKVRAAISGTALSAVPVGHVDTWNVYVNSSNSAVIEASDFLGLDEYPYYQTTDVNSIDNASTIFFDSYDRVQAVSSGKPIWITESGWPVSGPTSGEAVASIANAESYWQAVACKLQSLSINTWWYILVDAGSSPSFGVTGSLSTTPLYDLSCKSSSSSSSSVASSTSASSASSFASASSTSSAPKDVSASSSASSSAVSASASGSASLAYLSTAPGTVATGTAGSSGLPGASSTATTLGSSWGAKQTPTASSTSTAKDSTFSSGASSKLGGSVAALALGAVAAVAAL